LSPVEPVEDVAVEGVQRVQASTSKPGARRRRRLSNDEEREIARLYAETSTPTSQIRERFGIGDGSLYRAVQRQGVALRGRTATGPRSKPQLAPAPVTGRRRSSGANQAVSKPRSTAATTIARAPRRRDGRPGGRAVGRASVTENMTSSSGTVASRPGSDRHQFRVRFVVERTVEATDMRDALRQAESFGATEITAVSRED
jgi:transposase-like protein